MVGGGSPPELRAVQQRIIESVHVDYFNSSDRETTLTNVAAHKGLCLAPGFLNDRNPRFSWIPFDCEEHFSCVLCTHKEDTRPILKSFIETLTKLYQEAAAFPL